MRSIPVLGLLTYALALTPAPAQIVISQIYGGGGGGATSGAAYKNDFVELFNAGQLPQALTGYSIQYTSASGNSWGQNSALILSLPSVTLQPGQYYLVQMSGGSYGAALPAADFAGTIAMSATAGKILLSKTTTPLNGTFCPSGADILDMVPYGTSGDCTPRTASISASTAAVRGNAGCLNTHTPSTDFSSSTPLPRTTSSPYNVCANSSAPVQITTASPLPAATVGTMYSQTLSATGGSGAYTWSIVSGLPDSGLSLNSAGLVSGVPTTAKTVTFTAKAADSANSSNYAQANFSITVNPNIPTCSLNATIATIQGSGNTSPLVGQAVVTRGIVTGRKSNGFFIQMPSPGDSNPATSDGVFVFTSSAPPATAVLGNDVCVSATVLEYTPSADVNSPSMTELSKPTVTVMATGQTLPPAVALTSAELTSDDIYNLERYEGMRVSVADLVTVGPTGGSVNEADATASSNGAFYGVLGGVARPFRTAGVQLPDPLPAGSPCCVPRFSTNPQRLRIDTGSQLAAPLNLTSGVHVSGIVGPLDYVYRTYTVVVDASAPIFAGTNSAYQAVPVPSANELTVAGFNMQRFYDTTGDPSTSDVLISAAAFDSRVAKASLAIRKVLNVPDILGVAEVENLATLQAIGDKVNSDVVADGGSSPKYQAYLQAGNDVGGINVGFLVNSTRVSVIDVTQYGKDTKYTDPGGTEAILNDRPPLVLRARATKPGSVTALPVTVIANHLRSLSAIDDPADGPRVRAKRKAQADYLANLVQARQTTNPPENVVLLGDFNAFSDNDGYVDVMGIIAGVPAPANTTVLAGDDLVNPDLTMIESTIAAADRYSYVYDGNAQALDHMLMSSTLTPRLTRYSVGRTNSDFPESYRGDFTRPERLSDHDPEMAYFRLPETSDVTAQAKLTTTGLVYNRITKIWQTTVTVVNTGAAAITGPVMLFVEGLPAGVTLVNAAGTADGKPYVIVKADSLAKGASVALTLKFNAASTAVISLTPRLVAGTL